MLTLGPVLPEALDKISMVEIQGDAFVFGGYGGGSGGQSNWIYNSNIFQFSCSSGNCSWSTLNQELKVGRSSTVAIPVPDTFCV